MKRCLPIPPELIENPQLASIVLLERALEVTELALLAAYPDLWDGDPDTPSDDEAYAYAVLIFHEIDVLERFLDGYQRSLTRRARPPASPDATPL